MSDNFFNSPADSSGSSNMVPPSGERGIRQMLFDGMKSMGLVSEADAPLAQERTAPGLAYRVPKSAKTIHDDAPFPLQPITPKAPAAVLDDAHQQIADLLEKEGMKTLEKKRIGQAARLKSWRPATGSRTSGSTLATAVPASARKHPEWEITQSVQAPGELIPPARKAGMAADRKNAFHRGIAQVGNEGFDTGNPPVRPTPDAAQFETVSNMQKQVATEGFIPVGASVIGEAQLDDEQMDLITAQQQGGQTDRDQWQQVKDLEGPFADGYAKASTAFNAGVMYQGARVADNFLQWADRPDYAKMVDKDERERIQKEEEARIFKGTLKKMADGLGEEANLLRRQNQNSYTNNELVLRDKGKNIANKIAEETPGAMVDTFSPPLLGRALDVLDITNDMQEAYDKRMRELVLISDEDICRPDGPNPYWQVCQANYDGRDLRSAAMLGRKSWAWDAVKAAGRKSFSRKMGKALFLWLTRDGMESVRTRFAQHLSLNALEKALGEFWDKNQGLIREHLQKGAQGIQKWHEMPDKAEAGSIPYLFPDTDSSHK